MKQTLTAIILSAIAFSTSTAEIKLPAVITSNMVLQREKKVEIWGNASPGEQVLVSFAGQTKTTVTDSTSHWQVFLDPMPANNQPAQMTIAGKNNIILNNILVGEVWLCSGQSNMEYPMYRAMKRYTAPKKGEDMAEIELKLPKNPLIRFLYVERKLQSELPTKGWLDCNDSTFRFVTAAGYFFAKELVKELNVPVGIISSSWGGTRIEQWTPPTAYQNSAQYKEIASHPGFKIDGMVPGKMYEGMLLPIAPYTMKGILWYQGESNVMIHDSLRYTDKFKIMLDTWRTLWNDMGLPFYYVQIAPYAYSKRDKDAFKHQTDLLPITWEAQLKCLAFNNTGMIVTTDLVDDLTNIHPSYKWEVGRRLSLIALAKDYGKRIEYSGPVYQSVSFKGKKATIEFTHTGNGLITSDGHPLNWFTIAGEDRVFYPAKVSIKKNRLIVSSKEVKKPVAVRFAWSESAQPNFFNSEKLPASPFRTDNW